MLMIEPGRTNVVPRTMLGLCIVLFLLRAVVIGYGTFFQPPLENMIAWNQPKPIDKSRKDLLSTPTLYFFCDNSDQINKITTQILDGLLFHNREIAQMIKKSVIPVKVVLNGEKSDELSKSLKNSLRVTTCPAICIALPNGKHLDDTSWQSDRMFVAFLRDTLKRQPRAAAFEAMKHNDWALAARAYELDFANKAQDPGVDLYNTMYWSIALRHQNEDEKARTVLKNALEKYSKVFKFDKKDNWPEPCLKYMLGDISYDELMKISEEKKSKSTSSYHDETAHYIAGTKLLFEGKKDLAKKEFKTIAEDRTARYLYAAKFARAELRALGENVPEKDDDDDFSYY